jgi:hypothetical protein
MPIGRHGIIGHPRAIDKTITFTESNFASGASSSFGGTAPEGSICFVMATLNSNTIPSLPGGWTPIDTSNDAAGWGERTGYKIATAGGQAGTDTWTNADHVAWLIYYNASKLWTLGTVSSYEALSTDQTYSSCSPNGTTDWAVSLLATSGGFGADALTAGTNKTARLGPQGSGTPRFAFYDSAGVATTWPGSTTSPGFCYMTCRSFTMRAT